MEKYPKRRNGNEYYPKGRQGYVVLSDARGERYVRDKHGNECYLYRKQFKFLRDQFGSEYYARDKDGHEYYPIVKKRSLLIMLDTQTVRIAKYSDGTERYPRDVKGNEYYLLRENVPYLMKTHEGEDYLARNRRGCILIPWNHLHGYAMNVETPYIYSRDANGTLVYVNEINFTTTQQTALRYLCAILTFCPTAVTVMLTQCMSCNV